MLKRYLIITIIFVFSLSLLGCGNKEEVRKIDLTKTERIPFEREKKDIITYSCPPQYSREETQERHYRLIEYLKSATGFEIKPLYPRDFNQYMDMVNSGEIDICYSDSFMYVKTAYRYNTRAFAKVMEIYGKENSVGQIIARADSRINSIKDCIGKKWIAVDSTSTTGYFYQLLYFLDNGIEKKDFAKIDFVPVSENKHESVVKAVYDGKYDIGSISEGALNTAKNKYGINTSWIKVVAKTPWYPVWVYSANSNLDNLKVNKIKQALLKLDYNNPEQKAIFDAAYFSNITEIEDAYFDSVKELLRKVDTDMGKSK